jgi:hypothetical protein
MKALVVYESLYGNTKAIGEAIAASLRSHGLEVDAGPISRISPADVSGAALLVVGGPTHAHGMSRSTTRKTAIEDEKNPFREATADPGLHVFPTHRIFSGRPDLRDAREGEPCSDPQAALARLADEPYGRAAALAYRADLIEIVHGEEGELDVELVDRHGLGGIGYTPVVRDAVGAVDGGEADVAFILRDPRVGDVFAAARRGERMPPKSTYFFPKPLSGLLFHPVEL